MKGKEKKDDQKGEIFCILKYRIYSEALSFPIHYLALKHIYIYIYPMFPQTYTKVLHDFL